MAFSRLQGGGHPRVIAALDYMGEIEPTTEKSNYGSQQVWASREYLGGQKKLLGREAAVDNLYRVVTPSLGLRTAFLLPQKTHLIDKLLYFLARQQPESQQSYTCWPAQGLRPSSTSTRLKRSSPNIRGVLAQTLSTKKAARWARMSCAGPSQRATTSYCPRLARVRPALRS